MRRLILVLFFVTAGLPAAAQDAATAVSAAAHAACRVANDSVAAMFPGLQQTWSDNDAAQRLLAQAQERLHLASVPLQNSDCAGTGLGTPACGALDATYRAAREEVLRVEPAARGTARTYAINLSRYQTAARAATRLCATAVAADSLRARDAITDGDLVVLIQEILAQANALISAFDPAIDAAVQVTLAPPTPAVEVVTVPPPPTDATTPEVTVVGTTEANLTWIWEFRGATFNGNYTGDFATSWTFDGTAVDPVGLIGSAHCTGRNVPEANWEGGAGEMECTATFPATAERGPVSWQGSCRGYANYDGFLLKAGGNGSRTDDAGTVEAGMDSCHVRPGLAPV